MKLYEIQQLYVDFANAVESGEIEEETIPDTLESIDGLFEDKIDNIACLIKEWLADAEMIKTEEKALKERREAKEKRANSLKQWVTSVMLSTGKTKLETPRNALSFRKSKSLEIADEAFFMEKYPELVKEEIKRSIPKKAVTDRMKQGEEFVGVNLVERENLQIK